MHSSELVVAFGIGSWEWLVILLVALLLFGRRLPDIMRGLGSSVKEFKKGLDDAPPSSPAPPALPSGGAVPREAAPPPPPASPAPAPAPTPTPAAPAQPEAPGQPPRA